MSTQIQMYNNLLPGTVSAQVDYYTSKVTAVVSVTLTATDIQGVDLSKPLVLFWYHHQEGAVLATATLSWLSFIPNMLTHLAPLSQSPQLRSLKLCNVAVATCVFQTTYLPILQLTAILYVAAKKQLDVTSRQLNFLPLVCNWSIWGSFFSFLPSCL